MHKERLGTMVRILRHYIVVCLRVGMGTVAVGRFLACATDVEKVTAEERRLGGMPQNGWRHEADHLIRVDRQEWIRCHNTGRCQPIRRKETHTMLT